MKLISNKKLIELLTEELEDIFVDNSVCGTWRDENGLYEIAFKKQLIITLFGNKKIKFIKINDTISFKNIEKKYKAISF